jgi:hypothetical protein
LLAAAKRAKELSKWLGRGTTFHPQAAVWASCEHTESAESGRALIIKIVLNAECARSATASLFNQSVRFHHIAGRRHHAPELKNWSQQQQTS